MKYLSQVYTALFLLISISMFNDSVIYDTKGEIIWYGITYLVHNLINILYIYRKHAVLTVNQWKIVYLILIINFIKVLIQDLTVSDISISTAFILLVLTLIFLPSFVYCYRFAFRKSVRVKNQKEFIDTVE